MRHDNAAETETQRQQPSFAHARVSRRVAIQAGSVGILGLGMNHVAGLRGLAAETEQPPVRTGSHKAVIYIFLSGGLTQHDSFDPKPEAPDSIRGEFSPIATRTAGVQICEHLPRLAACSDKWSLVRSLTHPYNEHSIGHHVMLTGRTRPPAGFDPNRPTENDYPSIPSVVNGVVATRNNLPPAAVLPEKLIHVSGRTIPGQFAGQMGYKYDPWFIEASQFRDTKYIHGAFPQYGFQRWEGSRNPPDYVFEAPRLELPQGMLPDRLHGRMRLLSTLATQRQLLDRAAEVGEFDRLRQNAVTMLNDGRVHQAVDVHHAPDAEQDRYGRNSFGWSLLMARQLVEAGVSLVQVNLGNDEAWDTHEKAFINLKNFLFPPTDQAVSALLEDLDQRGMLEDTLVVMAGEFGRTPKIFTFKGAKSNLPGRDHWGAVQSVFLAGGGVQGGRVIGASDRTGGHPIADAQTPENLAATIYQSLGLPQTVTWKDRLQRPHMVYHGDPIPGLT